MFQLFEELYEGLGPTLYYILICTMVAHMLVVVRFFFRSHTTNSGSSTWSRRKNCKRLLPTFLTRRELPFLEHKEVHALLHFALTPIPSHNFRIHRCFGSTSSHRHDLEVPISREKDSDLCALRIACPFRGARDACGLFYYYRTPHHKKQYRPREFPFPQPKALTKAP